MADKPLRSQLWQMLGRALEYAVVWGYFYTWSYKTEVRKALKVSALGAIAVPTALLAAEVAAETLGAHEIAATLIALSASTAGKALFYIFIASVLFLLWHHVEEARKPGYEYVFVQRLCDFLEGRGDAHNPGPTVAQSLELFHSVFSKAGIAHASLHLWTGKELSIDPAHVFPGEKDPSFFVALGPGEGVAGRVWVDRRPRYVPRLYFPFRSFGLSFGHAISYSFQRLTGTVRRLELANEQLDFRVVKLAAGKSRFRAFLSVPVKSVGDDKCFGVMNFDFLRPDPLDTTDIAMAVVLGLLLGEELKRASPGGERERLPGDEGQKPLARQAQDVGPQGG